MTSDALRLCPCHGRPMTRENLRMHDPAYRARRRAYWRESYWTRMADPVKLARRRAYMQQYNRDYNKRPAVKENKLFSQRGYRLRDKYAQSSRWPVLSRD